MRQPETAAILAMVLKGTNKSELQPRSKICTPCTNQDTTKRKSRLTFGSSAGASNKARQECSPRTKAVKTESKESERLFTAESQQMEEEAAFEIVTEKTVKITTARPSAKLST